MVVGLYDCISVCRVSKTEPESKQAGSGFFAGTRKSIRSEPEAKLAKKIVREAGARIQLEDSKPEIEISVKTMLRIYLLKLIIKFSRSQSRFF